MKRLAILVACCLAASGCTVVSPAADEQAVLIDRPILFGKGGVRLDDVRKGGTRTYTWFSTQKAYLPASPQVANIRFDDFASKDNILLDFATNIRYQITSAPVLLQNFGPDWVNNNVMPQYTSIVREQVKQYDMADMISNPATAVAIDNAVTQAITRQMAEDKIPVKILSITLGRATPNPDVLQQMNTTAAEQQRRRTMEQSKLAEDARAEQQRAKALADNAYRTTLGLSPEQYLHLQITELQADACAKAASCTILPPGTAAVVK